MAITGSLAELLKENLNQQPVAPVQQQSWVKDLISQRYQPKTERLKRTPIGFNFQRDPFDPSSYYKQLGSYRDISRAATEVTNIQAQNRANYEAERAYRASQAALGGINPKFTYNGDGSEYSGKPGKYKLGGVSSNTQKQSDFLGGKFGIKTIGGYREHGSVPGSDHPKGLAADYMINNIKNGHRTGDALANYAVKNYKAMNIKYVIWNRYIWSPGRGWHKYSGPSPHTDHVHISYNK